MYTQSCQSIIHQVQAKKVAAFGLLALDVQPLPIAVDCEAVLGVPAWIHDPLETDSLMFGFFGSLKKGC